MSFVVVGSSHQGRTLYEADLFYCLRLEGEEAIKRLRECLCRGDDVTCKYKGWTFLGSLCCMGKLQMLKVVIDHLKQHSACGCGNRLCSGQKDYCRTRLKCVLNSYDDNGDTPLISAAKKGHLELCCLLVAEGADVNLQNQLSNQTPLLVAIESDKPDVAQFLIENFADVQQTDNVGITPLYSAIRLQSESIVGDLISSGCDVNIGSQDHAPLFYAARVGCLPIVKMLCSAGCAKNIANKYGVTPVYEATLKGHVDILEYLLEEGCNSNLVDMYGQSPLHVAALTGNLHAITLLYEAGAMCKLRNHQGQTAIDVALDRGRAEILEYLMEQGVNILRLSSRWRKKPQEEGYDVVLLFTDRLSFLQNASVLSVLIRGYASFCCEPLQQIVPLIEENNPNCQLFKLLFLSRTDQLKSSLSLIAGHRCKELSDWLEWFHSNPRSLKDLCRARIRASLGDLVLHRVKFLPLPTGLKEFITMKQLI